MKLLINPYLFTGVASLLLIGTLDLPYFYYEILRVVACAAFSWLSFLNYAYDDEIFYMILFTISVGFAILFNPLAPIYLDKELWIVLDIVSALFIFSNGIIVTNRISKEL